MYQKWHRDSALQLMALKGSKRLSSAIIINIMLFKVCKIDDHYLTIDSNP